MLTLKIRGCTFLKLGTSKSQAQMQMWGQPTYLSNFGDQSHTVKAVLDVEKNNFTC